MLNKIMAMPNTNYYKLNNSREKSNVVKFTGKCNIDYCKASCCYHVPLPIEHLKKYFNKIVNPVIALQELGKSPYIDNHGLNVLVFTDMNPYRNKCPFLTKENRCNIYENRPILCKAVGEWAGDMFQCKKKIF